MRCATRASPRPRPRTPPLLNDTHKYLTITLRTPLLLHFGNNLIISFQNANITEFCCKVQNEFEIIITGSSDLSCSLSTFVSLLTLTKQHHRSPFNLFLNGKKNGRCEQASVPLVPCWLRFASLRKTGLRSSARPCRPSVSQ